ncbi:conserved hypothetical protein [Stigmatella aurantiaca DW4/3-1]|uniref:Uncharacterized protein n=1 Tax=Stigmatella aurantiaca (strain DW4/3-1) TaxID=378806 RepID=Q091X6_STIAD|nr:conserved hypothetical protein [Stigmatella aurantiaca DW4/3-1]
MGHALPEIAWPLPREGMEGVGEGGEALEAHVVGGLGDPGAVLGEQFHGAQHAGIVEKAAPGGLRLLVKAPREGPAREPRGPRRLLEGEGAGEVGQGVGHRLLQLGRAGAGQPPGLALGGPLGQQVRQGLEEALRHGVVRSPLGAPAHGVDEHLPGQGGQEEDAALLLGGGGHERGLQVHGAQRHQVVGARPVKGAPPKPGGPLGGQEPLCAIHLQVQGSPGRIEQLVPAVGMPARRQGRHLIGEAEGGRRGGIHVHQRLGHGVPPGSGGSGGQLHHHLPGVVAAQQADEGLGGLVQPLHHRLHLLHLLLAEPAPHVAQEVRAPVLVALIADDEALEREALADRQREVAGARGWRGGVVLGDGATQDDAPVVLHLPDGRFQVLAAHVVEVDVDALGAGARQGIGHRAILVVEGVVEPEVLSQVLHLLRGARAAHHPAALDLGDLPHEPAHRAGRAGDEHRLARHGLAEIEQPHVGRHARHAEHPQVRGERAHVGIHLHVLARIGDVVLTPAARTGDEISLLEARGPRADHLAHRAAIQRLAQLEGGHVGLHVVHPPPHVRVHGHEEVAHQELALGGLGDGHLHQLEVARGGLALGPGLQVDFTPFDLLGHRGSFPRDDGEWGAELTAPHPPGTPECHRVLAGFSPQMNYFTTRMFRSWKWMLPPWSSHAGSISRMELSFLLSKPSS